MGHRAQLQSESTHRVWPHAARIGMIYPRPLTSPSVFSSFAVPPFPVGSPAPSHFLPVFASAIYYLFFFLLLFAGLFRYLVSFAFVCRYLLSTYLFFSNI